MEQPGTQQSQKAIAGQRLGLGAQTIQVQSGAFSRGEPIPRQFAGEHGRSPALRWSKLPAQAKELVLLCEDPDAPKPQPFVHWIVTGLPPNTSELPEGQPPSSSPLSSGAVQGKNDMGKHGYYGPEPPPGHGVHHYHFQVLAVRKKLDVRTPADRDSLIDALKGNVAGWGELVGTYER